MKQELIDIIRKIDISRPYIWELHLSESDYHMMDEYIRDHVQDLNYPTRDMALISIVYLAEWYKRYYCGSEDNQTNALIGADYKAIWEASGINTDMFVYVTDAGTHLWKYSIYILGGLAIRHELARKDRKKFLKALCRIFHGEEYTLENIDDESRAIAFRQSIIKEHSLYEYLRYILDGNCDDEDELVQKLVTCIKAANDEVLSSKFSFEWIVSNSPASGTMSRRLRLWLKPEDIGGKNHQYLRHDRIHLWGIPEPERKKNLFFGLRWRNEDYIIQDVDKNKALIIYSNSENGFVSIAIDRHATYRNVPVKHFTHIDVVAFDDDGNEWIVQTEHATDWMQLWRIDNWGDEWSSKQASQKQTAVVYANNLTADVPSDQEKPFKNKDGEVGSIWNWCYINSDITLTLPNGKSMQLFNRMGYFQVYTFLHKDTVRYYEGGKITYTIDDEEEGLIEEHYPLIFGPEDVRVRHFKTKNAIVEDDIVEDTICEQVEFKQGGTFVKWTDESKPAYGILTIRTYVKGVEHKFNVAYLGRITRNIEDCCIHYQNMAGEPHVLKDSIALDKTPIAPTILLVIDNIKIEVYRPIYIKEIYLDGNVHTYATNNFVLPYLFKARVKITDFSSNGYRKYDCRNLKSIFATFKGEDNQEFIHFAEYTQWPARLLDEEAPEWLNISLSKKADSSDEIRLLKWSLSMDKPEAFVYEPEVYLKQRGEIYFQDMTHPDEDLSVIIERPGRPDPFKSKKVKSQELRCFDIAKQYYSYFRIFRELRVMAQKGQTNNLLIAQLAAERNGKLTKSDKEHLLRLADEFCLDINKLDIDITF